MKFFLYLTERLIEPTQFICVYTDGVSTGIYAFCQTN